MNLSLCAAFSAFANSISLQLHNLSFGNASAAMPDSQALFAGWPSVSDEGQIPSEYGEMSLYTRYMQQVAAGVANEPPTDPENPLHWMPFGYYHRQYARPEWLVGSLTQLAQDQGSCSGLLDGVWDSGVEAAINQILLWKEESSLERKFATVFANFSGIIQTSSGIEVYRPAERILGAGMPRMLIQRKCAQPALSSAMLHVNQFALDRTKRLGELNLLYFLVTLAVLVLLTGLIVLPHFHQMQDAAFFAHPSFVSLVTVEQTKQ